MPASTTSLWPCGPVPRQRRRRTPRTPQRGPKKDSSCSVKKAAARTCCGTPSPSRGADPWSHGRLFANNIPPRESLAQAHIKDRGRSTTRSSSLGEHTHQRRRRNVDPPGSPPARAGFQGVLPKLTPFAPPLTARCPCAAQGPPWSTASEGRGLFWVKGPPASGPPRTAIPPSPAGRPASIIASVSRDFTHPPSLPSHLYASQEAEGVV